MERYTMFLDWKSQHCENDYSTQSNLQIQCNPYQTTTGIFHRTSTKNFTVLGFPGGAVVGSLPAGAGDMGSSPGLGGSRMPWSNWAREPQLLSLCFWSLCSAVRETAMVRGPCTAMKSGLRLPQLEKALAQRRRPNTAKNK